jgi:hypothetical protein
MNSKSSEDSECVFAMAGMICCTDIRQIQRCEKKVLNILAFSAQKAVEHVAPCVDSLTEGSRWARLGYLHKSGMFLIMGLSFLEVQTVQ